MNEFNNYTKDQLIKYIVDMRLKQKRTKYGLYWDTSIEQDTEFVNITQKIPFLSPKDSVYNGTTNNILIEGDNLYSLTLLNTSLQSNSIDFIYIDPPYNTGKNDFIYNDKFVNSQDGYRHSKWLTSINLRLRLAKNLLRDTGLIFISIDDNEQANLKLLCDKVFGEKNFVSTLATVMNLKGNNDQFGFAGSHEYTLVYSKDITKSTIGEFEIDDDAVLEKWDIDDIGYFKTGATLKATGKDSSREKRPLSFYPILVKNARIYSINDNEYLNIYDRKSFTFDDLYLKELIEKYELEGYQVILPILNGEFARWRWGFNSFQKKIDEIILLETKDGYSLYKKQRPKLGELPTRKPKSIFFKPEYSSGNGTNQLFKIIGKNNFNNPKPLQLIKDFIYLACPKNGIILDFFAGSGTTGQAVLELNQEDGGNRRFILCTNNENNICTDVTYPRLKTVITGIRPDGSKYNDGIPANLYYYKIDFIPHNNNADQSKYDLVEKVNYLLCIVENVYDLIDQSEKYFIYASSNGTKEVFMYIDYYEKNTFDNFLTKIQSSEALEKIVYVFTTDNIVDERLFEESKGIVIKPIPSKMYDIYKDIVEDIKRG